MSHLYPLSRSSSGASNCVRFEFDKMYELKSAECEDVKRALDVALKDNAAVKLSLIEANLAILKTDAELLSKREELQRINDLLTEKEVNIQWKESLLRDWEAGMAMAKEELVAKENEIRAKVRYNFKSTDLRLYTASANPTCGM